MSPEAETPMAPPTDSELVRRCRDGDEDAWRALVERHGPLVHALARKIATDGDDADDLFLQTFDRLLSRIDRIEQPERVRSWLVTTVKRLGLDARRRRRHWTRLESEGDDLVDDDRDPLEQLQALQERASVHAAMADLDRRCRELLTLLYLEPPPPSYAQIARRLDVAVGSIGPTRARCLEKLRRIHAGRTATGEELR